MFEHSIYYHKAVNLAVLLLYIFIAMTQFRCKLLVDYILDFLFKLRRYSVDMSRNLSFFFSVLVEQWGGLCR